MMNSSNTVRILMLIAISFMCKTVLGAKPKLTLINIGSVHYKHYRFAAYERPGSGGSTEVESKHYYIKAYDTIKKNQLCTRKIFGEFYRKNIPLDRYGKRVHSIKYYPKEKRHNRITSLKITKGFLVIKNEEGKRFLVRITDVSKFCGKKENYTTAYRISKVATLLEPQGCQQLNQQLSRLEYGKVYFQFLREWEKRYRWRPPQQEKNILVN